MPRLEGLHREEGKNKTTHDEMGEMTTGLVRCSSPLYRGHIRGDGRKKKKREEKKKKKKKEEKAKKKKKELCSAMGAYSAGDIGKARPLRG